MNRFVAALAGWVALAAFAGEVDPALPAYQRHPVAFPAGACYVNAGGAIVVVGYNDMREMLGALGGRFTTLYPEFKFAWDLPGTRAAPPALAAGRSALGPMGAEFSPAELAEFRAATGGRPLAIRVAHASLNPRALSGPLAIFVHRSNPLASLSLAEVVAIFTGRDGTRGLRPCGLAPATALGLFFRERALGGAALAPSFAGFPQSADVVERVGEDPQAIGFAAAMRATPDVKILAVAADAATPPVALTEENVRAGRYPLDRFLLIHARRPLEPWMSEFLRFALSRDGQTIIAAGTLGYLPLNAAEVAAELAKLDAAAP